MKRTLVAFAIVATLSSGLVPVRAAAPPPFVAKGKMTLCSDASFPPMEFFEKPVDPMPVGVDIDIALALATYWDVRLTVLATDFAGLLPGLSAGRCDVVISGILYSEERAKSFGAVPYLKTSIIALARLDATAISSPSDLSGKTVAVEAGTNYVKILEKLNADLTSSGKLPMRVQTYPKQTDAIQQVLIGRADATFTQDTEAGYRDLQAPGQLKTIYTYPNPDRFAIYLSKDAATVAAVSEAVDSLAADGAIAAILAKWKLPAGNAVTRSK